MKQNKTGLGRTTLIRDHLMQHGVLDKDSVTKTAHMTTERWKVGKRTFFLEVHSGGYNLFVTPTTDNDLEGDIEAIKNAAQ